MPDPRSTERFSKHEEEGRGPTQWHGLRAGRGFTGGGHHRELGRDRVRLPGRRGAHESRRYPRRARRGGSGGDCHVTPATWNPEIEESIAHALVENGGEREGGIVTAVSPVRKESFRAPAQMAVFLDPHGERIHA